MAYDASRMRRRHIALFLPVVAVVAASLLAGCTDMSYLLQSAKGHLDIVRAARPVDQWLESDTTPEALKQRLRLAQELRRYAVRELKLPDNASYTRYADLHRRAVVWNVVAAPAYALTPKRWCFPVTGCISYRGYYDEQDAQQFAAGLRQEGWETSVYPVPAYSTLGWTNWLGGDPLLSTFIQYPQGELARMVFHELAHQVLYVQDDTAFNESFATAVERLGGAQWLADPARTTAQREYADLDARRQAFRALTARTRSTLQTIYDNAEAASVPPAEREARKTAAYAEFRAAYAQLKAGWKDHDRQDPYGAWVANANNASFAALAAYDVWVSAFEALFARSNGDWTVFYGAAKALADLPPDARTRQLQLLQGALP